MSPNDEGYVVRIRGLPWSCTQEEVASFFSGRNLHDQEKQSSTNLDVIHHEFCFVGKKKKKILIVFFSFLLNRL